MRVNVTIRKRKRCTGVVLDYHDTGGRRHQRVFGKASTADELKAVMERAEVEAKRIEVEIADGVHKPTLGEIPIDAILTEFAKFAEGGEYRQSTRDAYRDTIKVFRRYLKTTRATRAKDLTPSLIIAFIADQKACALAPDTILTRLARLRHIFRRAVEQGVLAKDPTKHQDVAAHRPKSVLHERTFSDVELETFLEATATRPGRDAQDYADYYRLLAESGLRVSEGLMLRWCDIHFDGEHGDYLSVLPHDGWKPKTKKSIRTVPMSPRVRALLQARLRACPTLDPNARVWPSNWTVKSLGAVFNRVLKKVGLSERNGEGQKLRMHSLRHTFATRLVISGADPATTRDLLGHTTFITTNRYFNVPQPQLFTATLRAFGDDVVIKGLGAQPPIPLNAGASQQTSQTPTVLSGF